MDQKYYNISYAESPFGTLNQYMTRTYSWMAAGLLVTFATALLTVTTPLFELMFSTGLVFLLSIAELVLVAVLSARVERLQPTTATGLFFAYAVLNGINLSTYFIIYDLSTLILAFLVGTVYFGVMAVYGARTQRDLSGWGINLMGALIAIILTSLVGGGERQRIGVARAFLHDAPFVLMDEPTSNLDSLNEGVILKAVKEECRDKTVLLVSHRASTMAVANTVYSVESGRVS